MVSFSVSESADSVNECSFLIFWLEWALGFLGVLDYVTVHHIWVKIHSLWPKVSGNLAPNGAQVLLKKLYRNSRYQITQCLPAQQVTVPAATLPWWHWPVYKLPPKQHSALCSKPWKSLMRLLKTPWRVSALHWGSAAPCCQCGVPGRDCSGFHGNSLWAFIVSHLQPSLDLTFRETLIKTWHS